MKKLHYIFQILAYYLAWISGVELAVMGYPWLSCLTVLGISTLQILWQFIIMKKTKGLFTMILMFTLVGFIVDSLFLHFHLLSFTANPFEPHFSPPWMLALWFNFAILFYSVLEGFLHRYLVVSILSFIAYPLSYLSGEELGAAYFPSGSLSSLYLGLAWAVLFPLCLCFYNGWMKKQA